MICRWLRRRIADRIRREAAEWDVPGEPHPKSIDADCQRMAANLRKLADGIEAR